MKHTKSTAPFLLADELIMGPLLPNDFTAQFKYRVLSTMQPWASLMAYGYKGIENRNWHTTLKNEPLLIHASKTRSGISIEEINERYKVNVPLDLPQPTGAVIGEGWLHGCLEKAPKTTSIGKWFEGPHGFRIADGNPLKHPFPYPGRQGFFFLRVHVRVVRGELVEAAVI